MLHDCCADIVLEITQLPSPCMVLASMKVGEHGKSMPNQFFLDRVFFCSNGVYRGVIFRCSAGWHLTFVLIFHIKFAY